jgi:hypothetical protein
MLWHRNCVNLHVEEVTGARQAKHTGAEPDDHILSPQPPVVKLHSAEADTSGVASSTGTRTEVKTEADASGAAGSTVETEYEYLRVLKCDCGANVCQGLLECPNCFAMSKFEEAPAPQYKAQVVSSILDAATTVRQARKIAFLVNEKRSKAGDLRKRLKDFGRDQTMWLTDDAWRQGHAKKGGIFQAPGTNIVEEWEPLGPYELPPLAVIEHKEIILKPIQFECVFVNGVRKPHGPIGEDTAYEGFEALVEAVANAEPSFVQLLKDWTRYDYHAHWLAEELSHAQLKNHTVPAGGFDPEVLKLGMQACGELIDMLNIEFDDQ